jgi:hypothetical protein
MLLPEVSDLLHYSWVLRSTEQFTHLLQLPGPAPRIRA